jgi:methylenetetrahydrofolate--tRNA-(uracil-5-)-methyltransferase
MVKLTIMSDKVDLTVIGAGLAGSEAAWQAAQRGLKVCLFEMRPEGKTGAHQTPDFAELVCSNSLGSILPDRASGVLKHELSKMNSLLLECASATSLPAGAALAVDRAAFSHRVTEAIENHPYIAVVRKEAHEIPPGPVILASGPLTSPALSAAIQAFTGENNLYFYDAIAPIVHYESVDTSIAFRASRYDHGEQEQGDYINCPLTKEQYAVFVKELIAADRIPLREFESEIEQGVDAGARQFFEGCLPVEIIAQRGEQALAFGPMRPSGILDPATGRWPHAVVQLRQDNLAGNLYNLVGFQTNLTYPEQKRVFRMVPGLEKAEFLRFGQMHRNTFVAAPKVLLPTLQARKRADLFFAGQITGVEGYLGNIATGLLSGINASRLVKGQDPITLPPTTMIGALCKYITQADGDNFQPMKANFGILPPLETTRRMGRRDRARLFAERAQIDMDNFLEGIA